LVSTLLLPGLGRGEVHHRRFLKALLGRGWLLYEACYLVFLLIVLAVIAGIIAGPIARGYGTVTCGFLLVFVVGELTLGAYRVARGRREPPRAS
jgi:hypothetical protein